MMLECSLLVSMQSILVFQLELFIGRLQIELLTIRD